MPVEFTPSEAAALLKSATKERLAKFEQDIAELRARELSKACKSISCKPEPLVKPAVKAEPTPVKVKQARERRTGRYDMTDFSHVCANCGSTLGTHDAEAPHANDDELRGPQCDGFKREKVKKSEPPMAKPPSGKLPPTGNTVPTSKAEPVQKTDPGSAQHQAKQQLLVDSSRHALAPAAAAPQPKLPSAQENEARASMYHEAMSQVKAPAPVQSPVMKRRVTPKATTSAGPVLNAARPAAPSKPGIFGRVQRLLGS